MLKKGITCYEYIGSWEKFKEKLLPPEYQGLYNTTDVLFLLVFVVNFGKICTENMTLII